MSYLKPPYNSELILTYKNHAVIYKLTARVTWSTLTSDIFKLFNLKTFFYGYYYTRKGSTATIAGDYHFKSFINRRYPCHRIFIEGVSFPSSSEGPKKSLDTIKTSENVNSSVVLSKAINSSDNDAELSISQPLTFEGDINKTEDKKQVIIRNYASTTVAHKSLDENPFASTKALQDFFEVFKPHERLFELQPELQLIVDFLIDQFVNGAVLNLEALTNGLHKLGTFYFTGIPFRGFKNPFLYGPSFWRLLEEISITKNNERYIERQILWREQLLKASANYLNSESETNGKEVISLYSVGFPKKLPTVGQETHGPFSELKHRHITLGSQFSILKKLKQVHEAHHTHLRPAKKPFESLVLERSQTLTDFTLQSATLEFLFATNNNLAQVLAYY